MSKPSPNNKARPITLPLTPTPTLAAVLRPSVCDESDPVGSSVGFSEISSDVVGFGGEVDEVCRVELVSLS